MKNSFSGNTQKTGQNPAPAFYSERKTKIHEWRRKKEKAFAVATVLALIVFVYVGEEWPKWFGWPVHVVVSCGSTVMQDYWLTNRADITRLSETVQPSSSILFLLETNKSQALPYEY